MSKKQIIRTVDILGTPYRVTVGKKGDLKSAGVMGYVECLSKKIVIVPLTRDEQTAEKPDEAVKSTLRHEIVHAFIHESGLEAWNDNELLVDWIAAHLPAMAKASGQAIERLNWDAVMK